MKHPNPLMLLRIAQGDAFGLAVEYAKYPRDQELKEKVLRFERYYKHPTHSLQPGCFSDDTQMSVAVAEVLLKDPTAHRSAYEFTDSFIHCFKRDERDGYSRGFQAFLEKVTTPEEFLATIRNDSDKNGAAMRSVPIGVLSDPVDVANVAKVQAEITHNTIGGTMASVLVALMSHFALYTDEPLSELPDWLDKTAHAQPPPWKGDPVQGPGVGMNTARAVMTLLTTERTLLGIAKKTIEWGGDTDSVLAIAWGIASARMTEELPPFFEGGLENGPYGRTFLRNLGERLMTAFA
jgi:ADP-ribosyl-[dinitrogen reductase] hydrolase